MSHNVCSCLRCISGIVSPILHRIGVVARSPTVVFIFFIKQIVHSEPYRDFFQHLLGTEGVRQIEVTDKIFIKSLCFYFRICHILLAYELRLQSCFESLIIE